MKIEEGKFLYRLPDNTAKRQTLWDTNYNIHPIIQLKQKALNKHFGDRRKLSDISEYTNPTTKRTFVFAAYGSRANVTYVTIGELIGKKWLLMDLH